MVTPVTSSTELGAAAPAGSWPARPVSRRAESITTIGEYGFRTGAPSRLLPIWAMILPNSDKPEFGGVLKLRRRSQLDLVPAA
jgi:hypothetical protein